MCSFNLKNQFLLGYPNASTGTLPITEDEWYTDETRAHVLEIDRSGTYDILKLDPSNSKGENQWQAGDRAMIIQMANSAGITSGYFREFVVHSAGQNGPYFEIEIEKGFSPGSNLFVTCCPFGDPDARLQVLRIPRYFKVELDKATVKCSPWDGYTGGVLCYSAGQTKIKKSQITAAGCGYFPENATFGTGGNGGAGNNDNSGSKDGQEAVYNDYCLTPNPYEVINSNVVSGTLGEDGTVGFSGSSGLSGSFSLAYTYGSPDQSNYKAKMGSAGYAPPGQSGGTGGKGGGHGGKGGNSGDSEQGSDGYPGADGGKGGDAGRGARGGGIILIKTMNFVDPSGDQHTYSGWLSAAGQSGQNGRTGNMGGKGGFGGAGGIGKVVGSDVWFSGGDGGDGLHGTPANGGDGSHGGKGGTIFLYLYPNLISSIYPFDFSGPFNFESRWINLSSGASGSGGEGAFGYKHYDSEPRSPNGVDGNPYDRCETDENPPIIYSNYCDCDKAMSPFADEYVTLTTIKGSEIGPPAYYNWEGTDWESRFYYGSGKLVSIDKANFKIYHCQFNSIAKAAIIFEAILANGALTLFNSTIQWPAIYDEIEPDEEFKYIFKDEANRTAIIYHSMDYGDKQEYIEYIIPPSIYVSEVVATTSRCHPEDPGSDDSPKGNTGITPQPTTDVEYNDHFFMDYFAALIIPELKDNKGNVANIEMTYDPVAKVFVLTDNDFDDNNNQMVNGVVEVSQLKTIEIYDLTGRLLSVTSTTQQQFIIDSNNYSSGIYIIKVKKGNKISGHKMTVR
jgi:hypothetical protein